MQKDPDNNEENGLGDFIQKLFHISYIFYMILSVAGIIAYMLKSEKILIFITVVILAFYVLQLLIGMLTFASGLILIPAAAVIGYIFLNGIIGSCLCICILFLTRHIIRDVFYTLIFKFIEWVNKNSN